MLYNDCLIEIQTEELPAQAAQTLAADFKTQMIDLLKKNHLAFGEIRPFSTPRRLALLISALAEKAEDSLLEKRGPAKNKAFDEKGVPQEVAIRFAASLQKTPADLITIKTPQGEWVGLRETVIGKKTADLLPKILETAIPTLPVTKRMRWGAGTLTFARPIQQIFIMHGEIILQSDVLGYKTSAHLFGHRFHSNAPIVLKKASDYESALKQQHVIVDFNARRQTIVSLAEKAAHPHRVQIKESLLNEVTGLTEWPVALRGAFDQSFLQLPAPVLIAAMQNHQRYFPVVDEKQQLLPHFIVISNIESSAPTQVLHGYERVLHARLKDAEFFYQQDQKLTLAERIPPLKGMVFQEKLGSLYDKAERMQQLAKSFAPYLAVDPKHAMRAAWLAKGDLTTQMVNEFPELQGVMGGEYATLNQEPADVVSGIKEQYYPRFAQDELPRHPLGQLISLLDRIDTLVGTIGMNRLPTGDKDPYGLKRLAIGLIRLLIEQKIEFPLQAAIHAAVCGFQGRLVNQHTADHLITFIHERMKYWYLEKNITSDIFHAVVAVEKTNLLDIDARIQAVLAFKTKDAAALLNASNKRINHLLSQNTNLPLKATIDHACFEHEAESDLLHHLKNMQESVDKLYNKKEYDKILSDLATLNEPIARFFEDVMVMTEDLEKRANRLTLLTELQILFSKVADISLLQW